MGLFFFFFVDPFGSIEVAELNWGNVDHIKAVGPPFDYIIGTDVVSIMEQDPLMQKASSLLYHPTWILCML